ncbi:hypothetical protein [Thalassotalea sp. PLHSN55]|uniref:hypothetical protein n=1 Tax=Thalassotalea sp. PLHSN55 TaxID=3435888 RepID=UPI003F85C6E8
MFLTHKPTVDSFYDWQTKIVHPYIMVLALLILSVSSFTVSAKERIADKNNISQIVKWAKDGVTTKITFPEGLYLFKQPLIIKNNNLTLVGHDKLNTVLKLMTIKSTLIDATGNNALVKNLTLDGNNQQKGYDDAIFRFNKSKGHRFEHVIFKRSKRGAILPVRGWALDGLYVSHCEFEDIYGVAIHILNRNTVKRKKLITSIDQVIVKNSIFKAGYMMGVTLDAGNDRRNEAVVGGKKVGRRYVETVNMNNTIISDNVFEKTRKFHIAGVQGSGIKMIRNTFAGMTDDAEGGANAIHFEQFTRDLEFYDNTFSMANTVPKRYPYISIAGTEGHVRVEQKRSSDTYKEWTYFYEGSRERRANVKCAAFGHTDKSCKRDVHVYGVRNVYLAGNTFNASTKISSYLLVKEGENIQIGTKKDGTVSLNAFLGGDETTRKINFIGHDEGTCDVFIRAGQHISKGNVFIPDVDFDKPACRLAKPIIIE